LPSSEKCEGRERQNSDLAVSAFSAVSAKLDDCQ
jgi:hypothetical protein